MAISRPVFDSLNVPVLFAGSLNDDLRLSKAARAAGNRIAFVRSLVLPTMVDFTWRGLFEFVKRQYTQVKYFSPILYTGINIVLGFYVLGALSIVAALVYGYFYAWVPVAAAYVIDQFRALARQQVYLSLFSENAIRQKLFAAGWLEHMLTPLWIGLHWLLLATTWRQNKLTWAGVRYQIDGVNKTRVLSRPAGAAKLPAGAPGLAMLGALSDRKRRHTSLSPAAAEREKPVTLTVADDPSAGVTLTPAGKSTAAEAGSTRPTGSFLTVKATVPHPGGPGAVIPLTTTFYDRPLRYLKIEKASGRGAFSAVEAALTRTRVRTMTRYAVRSVSDQKPTVAAERLLRHPFPGPATAKVLSSAEIVLTKTRLEEASHPSKRENRPKLERSRKSSSRPFL